MEGELTLVITGLGVGEGLTPHASRHRYFGRSLGRSGTVESKLVSAGRRLLNGRQGRKGSSGI